MFLAHTVASAPSEHPILARVELVSAAEVGDLSHEITSLAAAISDDSLREPGSRALQPG